MQSLSFETAYGEFFEQALWHVFQRIGITPSMLRGDTIRMAGVQQTAVCLDAQTRKPCAFPIEITQKAQQIINGETS